MATAGVEPEANGSTRRKTQCERREFEPPATRAAPTGAPSIKILSPKPGETVSGSFDVTIGVKNIDLICAEMGKPDVPGHGHWHLNFDTMKGPMMGMMTMAAMSCDQTLHASTAGLKPGSSHKLIALLAHKVNAPLYRRWRTASRLR